METIYRTKDGQEFTSRDEAVKHEEDLNEAEKRIKCNLATYLANKSRLKAGILNSDIKELNRAWEEWIAILPRDKFCHDKNAFQKLLKALYRLEYAAEKYAYDTKKLREAKEMIPRLNAAIRGGGRFYGDELLRQPTPVCR